MNPTLRTGRLELRPVGPSDLAALLEHWGDPRVARFLFDDTPPTSEQVVAIIEAARRDFAAVGYGVWTLRPVDREGPGRELTGTTGLRRLEEEGRPGDDADVEILYSLRPDRWGRGLAAEAAEAVLEHAFATLGLPRVLARADEGNTASVALALRLGLRPTGTEPGTLGPVTRLAVERDRWLAARRPREGRAGR
ncbi:GNAT family N-acetyltransferase [Thermomonospora umbrina]|uniref:RimJ/RimL family protein N-acetyltransferase n=1 Tax=Thermomonospora umbrina TaxID=111806 RepID=A0A3D9SZY3_9ACTN|nr:GNAT family N-acetyltransferase [Thermomonospora umbrina]REF01138.1 RimJ/RimL family protein N-acetyltransferase [Thermomonospora umbrina]